MYCMYVPTIALVGTAVLLCSAKLVEDPCHGRYFILY